MADKKRAARVAERVKEELALVVSREAKDPRLAGVIVSRVELTDDLRHARVYVRLLTGGDEARQKEALAGLARASGLLRREVTVRAGLRFAPELEFRYDEGQDARDRIEQLLEEVRREGKSRG